MNVVFFKQCGIFTSTTCVKISVFHFRFFFSRAVDKNLLILSVENRKKLKTWTIGRKTMPLSLLFTTFTICSWFITILLYFTCDFLTFKTPFKRTQSALVRLRLSWVEIMDYCVLVCCVCVQCNSTITLFCMVLLLLLLLLLLFCRCVLGKICVRSWWLNDKERLKLLIENINWRCAFYLIIFFSCSLRRYINNNKIQIIKLINCILSTLKTTEHVMWSLLIQIYYCV